MRDDQHERLQRLSERLADVLISEIDPDKWPGAGMEIAQMDRPTRGDRYWCKKNVGMTLTVLTKLQTILALVQNPPDDANEQGDLEAEISAAEAAALRAIEQAQRRAKGATRRRK